MLNKEAYYISIQYCKYFTAIHNDPVLLNECHKLDFTNPAE